MTIEWQKYFDIPWTLFSDFGTLEWDREKRVWWFYPKGKRDEPVGPFLTLATAQLVIDRTIGGRET